MTQDIPDSAIIIRLRSRSSVVAESKDLLSSKFLNEPPDSQGWTFSIREDGIAKEKSACGFHCSCPFFCKRAQWEAHRCGNYRRRAQTDGGNRCTLKLRLCCCSCRSSQSAAGGTIPLVDEIQQTVAVRRSNPEGREAFRLLMDAEIEFFEKSLRVQQPSDSGE
jgi:hypothetical protein